MQVTTYSDPSDPKNVCTTPEPWLSDEGYLEVVAKTVVTCVDAIVISSARPGVVYLAKRVAKPAAGIWFLGGRAQFNTVSMHVAIAENVERETGVRFDSDRFRLLTVNDYKFACAAQGDFPCRSLALLFVLEATEEEISNISNGLVASEYEREYGLRPFTRAELEQEHAHPALLDAWDMLWSAAG